MDPKSLVGLFAIISPDNTVSALYYQGEVRHLYRTPEKVWLDAIDFPENEQDSLHGVMIPVIDEFIDVYDEAVAKGKRLVDEDTDEYLRDMEF